MTDRRHDINDELRAHVEARVAYLRGQGVPEEQARRDALARFPEGIEQVTRRLARQAVRHHRRITLIEVGRQWMADLRLSGRGLIRQRAFTLGVVGILTLGLGVNAAVFRVAYDLLLRPPALVQRAADLYRIESLVTFDGGTPQKATAFSYPDAQRLTTDTGFASAGVYTTPRTSTLGNSREVAVSEVDEWFLPLLGVAPQTGRHFTAEEARPGSGIAVAIVSARVLLRDSSLPASPSEAIGADITLGGKQYHIVGVLPAAFGGIDLDPIDVWLPLGVASRGRGFVNGVEIPWYQTEMMRAIRVVVRRDGPDSEQSLSTRATTVLAAADRAAQRPARTATVRSVVPVGDASRADQARQLVTRLTLVALVVLLIAVANATNLLLAHGLHRQQEIAVRVALGAGRARIVRLLLMQSLWLACASGLAAAVAGHWTAQVLWRSMFPDSRGGPDWIDPITLAVTAVLAVTTGVVAGLFPAWQATRAGVMTPLRAGQTIGHRRSTVVRAALVVGQTALSVTLLVMAGLLVLSLMRLATTSLGFAPEGLVTASVNTLTPRLDPADIATARDAMTRGLRPDAIATATVAPFGATYIRSYRVPGTTFEPESPEDDARTAEVSANYFDVLGTRLLEGRMFSPDDTLSSDPVALVNASMKRKYWGDTIPDGACVLVGVCARVIGVVEDIRESPVETPAMRFYLPISQTTRPATVVITRVPGDAVASVVTQWRAASSSGLRVLIDVVSDRVDVAVRPWRLATMLFVVLAVIGLVLAAAGLYSVVNYLTTERMPEFGLRIVLGATDSDVVRLVMREAATLLYVGAAVGLAGALLSGRYINALLFNVSPRHPGVYVAAVLGLAAAALFALWRPARRAALVNPVDALRRD